MISIDWTMATTILAIGSIGFLWFPQSAQGYSVAATVALLVAFVAYPWQKELDRKADFEIEQRAALRIFLENWYSIEADTRDLRVFNLAGKEPLAFNKLLLELRTRRKKLTYGFILICAEEDLAPVIELEEAHEAILDEFERRLQNWIKDPNNRELPATDFMDMVVKSISVWEPRHKVQLEKLTNSCRERTPFVEHKTLLEFDDGSRAD